MIEYGPSMEDIQRLLRKKVGIDEFLNIEKIIIDKASAANVLALRSGLDGLRYSYE